MKLIAAAQVKTDKVDVHALARLLAAGFIPEVWVPPVPVRELRSLLAHRRRLIKNRTMLQNRLHSVLHRHHLVPPEGDPFLPAHQAWWEALPVSPTERLHLRHDRATLAVLGPQVAEVESELERLSTAEPWADAAPYLMQLPGVGLIVTLTLLAAIGDITRFPTAKKLVGYAGLGSRVHDSGQRHRTGGITKSGRRDLRWALIEAAWRAVDCQTYWKEQYEHLTRRMEPNKAIVVIAHKLLIAVWHVLTERAADRHADPELVAFKLMTWSWKLTDEQRGGLTTRQYVHYHLLRLKLGDELTHVVRGGAKRLIAPAEEVLALKPELRASA